MQRQLTEESFNELIKRVKEEGYSHAPKYVFTKKMWETLRENYPDIYEYCVKWNEED